MKPTKLTLFVAAAAVAGLVVMAGCGDDDSAASSKDAGNDVAITPTEAGGGEGGPDGGPCKFNDFVTGLITNSTTATALPSTDLGDTCTDDQTPFPATLFQ